MSNISEKRIKRIKELCNPQLINKIVPPENYRQSGTVYTLATNLQEIYMIISGAPFFDYEIQTWIDEEEIK